MADGSDPGSAGYAPNVWSAALKEAGASFLISALVLAAFYGVAFRWIHPDFSSFMDREATPLIASGNNFIPISVGEYEVKGDHAVIKDFNLDEAILALPLAFRAEDYPFIKIKVRGLTRFTDLKILWRLSEDPSVTYAAKLQRSGDEVAQLAMAINNKNYRGEVADIALLFFDRPAAAFENNHDRDVVLLGAELLPFSASRVVEQLWEDWANPPLWSAVSNNIVTGAHQNAMLQPNAIVHAWVIMALCLTSIKRGVLKKFSRRSKKLQPPYLATALCVCLLGWLANDIQRWAWRLEQVVDTHTRYEGKNLEQRGLSSDVRCARFPDSCQPADLKNF